MKAIFTFSAFTLFAVGLSSCSDEELPEIGYMDVTLTGEVSANGVRYTVTPELRGDVRLKSITIKQQYQKAGDESWNATYQTLDLPLQEAPQTYTYSTLPYSGDAIHAYAVITTDQGSFRSNDLSLTCQFLATTIDSVAFRFDGDTGKTGTLFCYGQNWPLDLQRITVSSSLSVGSKKALDGNVLTISGCNIPEYYGTQSVSIKIAGREQSFDVKVPGIEVDDLTEYHFGDILKLHVSGMQEGVSYQTEFFSWDAIHLGRRGDYLYQIVEALPADNMDMTTKVSVYDPARDLRTPWSNSIVIQKDFWPSKKMAYSNPYCLRDGKLYLCDGKVIGQYNPETSKLEKTYTISPLQTSSLYSVQPISMGQYIYVVAKYEIDQTSLHVGRLNLETGAWEALKSCGTPNAFFTTLWADGTDKIRTVRNGKLYTYNATSNSWSSETVSGFSSDPTFLGSDNGYIYLTFDESTGLSFNKKTVMRYPEGHPEQLETLGTTPVGFSFGLVKDNVFYFEHQINNTYRAGAYVYQLPIDELGQSIPDHLVSLGAPCDLGTTWWNDGQSLFIIDGTLYYHFMEDYYGTNNFYTKRLQ